MRLDCAVLALSLLTGASAAAVSQQLEIAQADIQEHDLYKRKGGGGGGGRGGGSSGSRGGGSSGSGTSGSSSSSGSRGGGSSGSGSSGSSSSSGSRGGSSSSSSSGSRSGSGSSGSRGSPTNTGPSVNSGGTTKSGSGPQPQYGGGQYYGGGSRVPYSAGAARNGIVPGLLLGSALFFWPGVWASGAYMYNYHDPYRFRNQSNDNKEEELPVICGCAEGAECGCDDSGNVTAHLNDLVGNGSYAGLNQSVVTVGTKDGQKVLLVNGTLPNGTTAKGDADMDADGNPTSAAAKKALETMGFWPLAAIVGAIVFAA
ncbi:hypothetical protein ISF_05291 [Cordyceps fumosorosea ARSEF 2679]|uniref:DUF7732 domain-containing protein n=1 Tax=Cordyceps fumosorosea (strain ARSEF 2679) TaxID=1081104 RepID=A0A162J164_CORFA|nr:hypothetical protein ISF_05291 [Cordyceps fumosorosea ARSEF 2679]OAA62282.1 hypothetical protein ISF_05291 [Cordyceps fumosorosea ARSEF 2679]